MRRVRMGVEPRSVSRCPRHLQMARGGGWTRWTLRPTLLAVRTLGRGGRGLHQLLESFAREKGGDRFRRNRDRVTYPWVVAFPGWAVTEPEASKASQCYGLSRLQRRHKALQELRQHRVNLTFHRISW